MKADCLTSASQVPLNAVKARDEGLCASLQLLGYEVQRTTERWVTSSGSEEQSGGIGLAWFHV